MDGWMVGQKFESGSLWIPGFCFVLGQPVAQEKLLSRELKIGCTQIGNDGKCCELQWDHLMVFEQIHFVIVFTRRVLLFLYFRVFR